MHQKFTREIGNIWKRFLGEETIFDIDSSFFESGGNSMLAVRMLAQVMAQYEIQLDLEPFFKEPTIKILGELVAAGIENSEGHER